MWNHFIQGSNDFGEMLQQLLSPIKSSKAIKFIFSEIDGPDIFGNILYKILDIIDIDDDNSLTSNYSNSNDRICVRMNFCDKSKRHACNQEI